jgi:hypothetical protein
MLEVEPRKKEFPYLEQNEGSSAHQRQYKSRSIDVKPFWRRDNTVAMNQKRESAVKENLTVLPLIVVQLINIMSDAYGNLKASELRALLKTKHNNEPPKAMLKSQMLQLLLDLDEKAAAAGGAAAAASAPASSPAVAPSAAEAKEEAKPAAKKSAVAAKAKATSSPAAAAVAKSSASSAPTEATTAAPAKASTAKAAAAKPAPAAKSQTATAPESAPIASSSAPSAASIAGNDPLSAARLAARAKRFGTSEEKAKLVERAERFGLPSPVTKDPLTQRAEAAQKREEKLAQKQADREAFNARAERFGLPIKVDSHAEAEKKRARAERFAPDGPNKRPKFEEQ